MNSMKQDKQFLFGKQVVSNKNKCKHIDQAD